MLSGPASPSAPVVDEGTLIATVIQEDSEGTIAWEIIKHFDAAAALCMALGKASEEAIIGEIAPSGSIVMPWFPASYAGQSRHGCDNQIVLFSRVV